MHFVSFDTFVFYAYSCVADNHGLFAGYLVVFLVTNNILKLKLIFYEVLSALFFISMAFIWPFLSNNQLVYIQINIQRIIIFYFGEKKNI